MDGRVIGILTVAVGRGCSMSSDKRGCNQICTEPSLPVKSLCVDRQNIQDGIQRLHYAVLYAPPQVFLGRRSEFLNRLQYCISASYGVGPVQN